MSFLRSLDGHDHSEARAFAGGFFTGLEEIGCETEEVAGGIGQGVGHGWFIRYFCTRENRRVFSGGATGRGVRSAGPNISKSTYDL